MPLNWKRDNDDVMLDPQVFRHARRVLKFKPEVDLFASKFHHQLPRYCALEADPNAAGRDAFTANWLLEFRPYIIPPWHLIPECLEQIRTDQAEVMMVVPKLETVASWPIFVALCTRFIDLDTPSYLRADKTLWKKPELDPRIGILVGNRDLASKAPSGKPN